MKEKRGKNISQINTTSGKTIKKDFFLTTPYDTFPTVMATSRRTRFSRRIPDHVTDELVKLLSTPRTLEFNELFQLVYGNLKLRNAVSGGEEMLRFRAYEKLQTLVTRGYVEKKSKAYRGSKRIGELMPEIQVA